MISNNAFVTINDTEGKDLGDPTKAKIKISGRGKTHEEVIQ